MTDSAYKKAIKFLNTRTYKPTKKDKTFNHLPSYVPTETAEFILELLKNEKFEEWYDGMKKKFGDVFPGNGD